VRSITPQVAWYFPERLDAERLRSALFAARLTATPEGCVLGITWHHMLGDLHSPRQLGLFVRLWLPAELAGRVADDRQRTISLG
jgi:hypothetical protein